MRSWITLYPDWYISERVLLSRHYPVFRPDEPRLAEGVLALYGWIEVRPPGGTERYHVKIEYPDATPYEHPRVIPLTQPPKWTKAGAVTEEPPPCILDHRHQMPLIGNLCLYQRETRLDNALPITNILRRAERWFLGIKTGRWPPDTAESELESHFIPSTDALLPEQAFDESLHGRGRMFLVRDLRRQWLDQHQDSHFQQFELSPFLMTGLTVETAVVKPIDARKEFAAMYPWVRDKLYDPTKLAAAREPNGETGESLANGYWWSLPVEPRPFRDGAGFLRELASADEGTDAWGQVSSMMGSDLALAPRFLLGFKYPARRGGHEWLMVAMPGIARMERGGVIMVDDHAKRKLFDASPVLGIRVHRLKPEILRMRNTSVVDGVVAEKTVALIGLGSLGSKVAEMLAQAGVGHFRLCDYDYLATGNVARHIGGVSDFGARKTRVVMSRLLEINPHLRFDAADVLYGCAVSSLDGLANWIGPADLVVSTTADESTESVLNEIAILCRKPVVYGRTMRAASMGRVFLVRPGQDACKACLAAYRDVGRAGRATPSDWIDVPEDLEVALLHECGRPVLPGSAVDLSFAATLIARVALDFLESRDAAANHWVWSARSASNIDRRLAQPLSTFLGQLPKYEECRVCREPEVAEIVMTDEVRDAIVAMTEASPDRETGGVLIGFRDGARRVVAIQATGPGPRARRSRKRFRREVAYVQREVDRAAARLGNRGMYVGEWHSHRSAVLQPSHLDVESLFGIADAPNYLTRCPVMVIAGLDPATGKVAETGAWAFPVTGRMTEITQTVMSCDVASKIQPRCPCSAD